MGTMCTHSGRGLHSPRPTIGCLAHGQGSRELTRPKMSVSVAERHLTGTAGSKQLHHPRGDVLGPRQLGAVCHSATKPTRGELGLQDFDLGNRIERVWGCTGACSEWCDQTFRSPPYTLRPAAWPTIVRFNSRRVRASTSRRNPDNTSWGLLGASASQHQIKEHREAVLEWTALSHLVESRSIFTR